MRALFRLSRAAVVAGMTVFLSAAAHVAAGGTLPDPLITTGLLALVLLPAIAMSRRRLSTRAVLAILISGQFALHEAFDQLSVSATSVVLTPAAGHVHLLGEASQATAGHVHVEGGAMLIAHAIATLATGLMLARGEAALWALLAWLRPLARLLAAVVVHPAPEVPAFTEPTIPQSWRGPLLPSRRGPPRAFTVCTTGL